MIIWSTENEELTRAAKVARDREIFKTTNGLYGYGEWSVRRFSAGYTHRDGSTFKFESAWRTGSGSDTRRCMGFCPKQPCIVTVVYSSQPGRPLFITQCGRILASGTEAVKDGIAPSIAADITDPGAGDVIIRGGASDKDVFAIIVEYYNPADVVCCGVCGSVRYNGKCAVNGAEIVFCDTADGTKYIAPFGKAYSVRLRRSREYEISISGAEGVCPTLASDHIKLGIDDITADLEICDIAPKTVTGDIVIHRLYQTGTEPGDIKLYFINGDSKYKAEIKDGKFKLVLAPGRYRIYAENIPGYELSELSRSCELKAGDMKPFKNILIGEKVRLSEYTPVLEVGCGCEFSRINDALLHIGHMARPVGESGRVTIIVHEGTYTEQVNINAPYVTLIGKEKTRRPTVRFYYGIGYLYYSAAANGYYDEDCAVSKLQKRPVAEWGPVCRVTADHVTISNIVFKNTFNCELTDVEFADGCAPASGNEYPDTSGKQRRDVPGYDVMAKASTERAAAIAVTGDNCNICGCDFISSQDTFYTWCRAYVKDCYIEGGADYVFGGGDVVFDGCTLAWHGFSDGAYGGYISANKNPNKESPGHLFINCTVTVSKYYPENLFAPGSWGRNWGGELTRAVFKDTAVRGIGVPGKWVAMNGDLSRSELHVTGVTDTNGNIVDTSPYNPNGFK